MTQNYRYNTKEEYLANLFGRRETLEKQVTVPDAIVEGFIQDKISDRVFSYLEAGTYGQALASLREQKNLDQIHFDAKIGLYRPLTFVETLEARIEDYNTLEDANGKERTQEERSQLWKTDLFTSTGIIYKANTKKFKIIPLSYELLQLSKGFNESFLSVDYDKVQGIELDASKGKYYQGLTQQEVLSHLGWRAAVGDDANGKRILQEYSDIYFHELKENKGMCFWIRDNVTTNELRTLAIYGIGIDSDANGSSNLYDSIRFALVAQVGRRKAPRKGEIA